MGIKYHQPFLTDGISTIQLYLFRGTFRSFDILLSGEAHVRHKYSRILQELFQGFSPPYLYSMLQCRSFLIFPENIYI